MAILIVLLRSFYPLPQLNVKREKKKWTCLLYLTSTSQPANYQPANTIVSNRPAVPSLYIHYPPPEPQNIFIPQKRHG